MSAEEESPHPLLRSQMPEFVRCLSESRGPSLRERPVRLEGVELAFNRAWLARRYRISRRLIRAARVRRRDTLVLVGNGPGLRETDLSLLAGHDVMISNYAHLNPKLIEAATYWCVVNPYVAAQASGIETAGGVVKFMPFWLAAWWPVDDNTALLPGHGDPRFSEGLLAGVSVRSTVSYFGLQVAFHLGYREVVLIGFDHAFAQPPGALEGTLLHADGADPNHFDDRYFRDKYWQAADLERMEYVYACARQRFEADGRRIVNCSARSALRIFERKDLAETLGAPKKHSTASLPPQRPLRDHLEAMLLWCRSRVGRLALLVCAALEATVVAIALTSFSSMPQLVTICAAGGVLAAGLFLLTYAVDAGRRSEASAVMEVASILRRADEASGP